MPFGGKSRKPERKCHKHLSKWKVNENHHYWFTQQQNPHLYLEYLVSQSDKNVCKVVTKNTYSKNVSQHFFADLLSNK